MLAPRATIIDVAARAGVSWKTVSRVLNREPNVRPEKVAAVESAMRALHFQPNVGARALRGARSFLLGAVTDNLADFYYTALNRGGAKACRAAGYDLAIEEIDLTDPGALGSRLIEPTR